MENFEVVSKIGQGAFASVYKAKRKQDGGFYAMKKIHFLNRSAREIANCLNEVRILASISHPYVLAYREAFYHEPESSLVLITEFAAGGDLSALIKQHQREKQRIPEEQIWRMAIQLLFGLRALHRLNVFHRDVKSANVLLSGGTGEARLGDLNVSKVSKSGLACTQTGTPYYASPEVWKDKPYGPKSDMWSLGCVCYEMAALRPPFTATDLQGLYKKVCTGMFERIPAVYSNDLATVISALLKVDPEKRPSAEQILSHSLVRKHYDGKLEASGEHEEDMDELLKTIKYNPRDLKALKNMLPKANYEEDVERERLKI